MWTRAELVVIKCIAFSLPFSTDLPLTGNAMISIPSEVLTLLAALMLMIRILLDPSWLHSIKRSGAWCFLPLFFLFPVSILFSDMPLISAKSALIQMMQMMVFLFLCLKLFITHRQLFIHLMALFSLGMMMAWGWAIYQYAGWEYNPVTKPGIFMPFYNDHTIFGASAAILAVYWLAVSPQQQTLIAQMAPGMAGL